MLVRIRIQPVCAAVDKRNIGSFLGQALSKGIHNLGKTDIIHLDRSRASYWKTGFGEVLEGVTGNQLRQQSTGSGSQGENPKNGKSRCRELKNRNKEMKRRIKKME